MAMPLRHIMSLHAETAGSDVQGVVGRIDASISFGTKLAEAGARYFAANAGAKSRLEAIAGQNRHYLAHEYFNRDWTPMYFSDAHDWLTGAKLGYACPAAAMDHLDGFNLSQQQREIINGIPYSVLRETVRDYMVNQQFRRDLYTRGARRLSPLERIERLHQQRITLSVAPDEIPFEVESGLGKVSLKGEIYAPIIEELAAGDSSVKTIGELAERPRIAALAPGALSEALSVLIGTGRPAPPRPRRSPRGQTAHRPPERPRDRPLADQRRHHLAGLSGAGRGGAGRPFRADVPGRPR